MMGRVLKILFFTGAAVVVALFFLSITGIIENSMGNSFGFQYKTGYASFLLTMALIYVILANGYLTWAGEIGLIGLTGYVVWLGGKTSSILLFILTFILMWRHYRRNGGVPFQDKAKFGALRFIIKVLYLPVIAADFIAVKLKLIRLKKSILGLMRYSFFIFCGINFAMALTYRHLKWLWNLIPGLSTFKDRLVFALLAFEEYGLSWFGTFVALQGTYGEKYSSMYFVIDSAYVRFFLEKGIVPFVVSLCILTVVMFVIHKKRFNIALFALMLLSVDLTMDYSVLNLLMLMVFLPAYFLYSKKNTVKDCDRINFSKFSVAKRWVTALVSIAVIAVLSVWCVTAYKITNWRGHTPEYGATLVVPRSVMNADETVLTEAFNYLDSHQDAACIVDSASDRDWLSERGIDESRVLVDECSSLDEAITSAHEMIEENNLPVRLTVCAYSTQQQRVSRHADELNIPINSLSVRPSSNYYGIFTAEQWRLICGD